MSSPAPSSVNSTLAPTFVDACFFNESKKPDHLLFIGIGLALCCSIMSNIGKLNLLHVACPPALRTSPCECPARLPFPARPRACAFTRIHVMTFGEHTYGIGTPTSSTPHPSGTDMRVMQCLLVSAHCCTHVNSCQCMCAYAHRAGGPEAGAEP